MIGEWKCRILAGLKQLTMGQGKSEIVETTALVIQALLHNPQHQMTKRQLLSEFWGEFDAVTLDRIIEILLNTGAVEVHLNPDGKNTNVILKEVAELYLRFKTEVN